MLKYLVFIIFITLSVLYYLIPFSQHDSSHLFLTISTFLFAIFAGFFIARQGRRYSTIRNQIANFDGEISSIYRHFGHLGTFAQEKAKKIIKKHYEIIIKKKAWNYHFLHKSKTLSSIHALAEEITKGKNLNSLKQLALQRILFALERAQVARKNMVAIHRERIPIFQWALIYFLAIILLLTLSIIPSQFSILGSVLKGAFASFIISVLILLYEFDKLKFFEKTIGEKSAQDVLDILMGKR